MFKIVEEITARTITIKMPYLSSVIWRNSWNWSHNVFIGSNSASSLTHGDNNIIIGSTAGKNIVQGSGNVLIGNAPQSGSYPGEPVLNNSIILTTGSGNVRALWDQTSSFMFGIGNHLKDPVLNNHGYSSLRHVHTMVYWNDPLWEWRMNSL